ncbi:MAG: hypothetical protein QM572_19420 [Nocardioides sp.]|uniref:hypothetical protein n=1 Tax=Nocardioides sp. TaxID=35761 RepID=UPI0039E49ADE
MGALEIVGWVGSGVLVLSLLQTQVLRFRLVNTVGTLVLFGYQLALHIWPMVALNGLLAVINLVFVARLLRDRHRTDAFEVLRVDGEDPYLQRIMTVQAREIASFAPGVDAAAARSADHAFVILKGTEIVGVVLIRADGDIARVVLDYVVPRYRDLTPGEFLWQRSDFLRDLGFNHVMTPRGVDYYRRLGFRPNGREFVLAL